MHCRKPAGGPAIAALRSVARAGRDGYIGTRRPGFGGRTGQDMRAEIEKLVEEIKQSVGLLRRHL